MPYSNLSLSLPRKIRGTARGLPMQIADVIADAIAEGTLVPGDRLVEASLTETFGVSRVPVREALKILSAQGIVSGGANQGFKVAAIDAATVDRVMEIRLSLESFLLRDAMARWRAGEADFSGLDRAIEDLAASTRSRARSRRDSLRADLEFHRAIGKASGNDLAATLWEGIARHVFIIFSQPQFRDADIFAVIDQHQEFRDRLKRMAEAPAPPADLLESLREHMLLVPRRRAAPAPGDENARFDAPPGGHLPRRVKVLCLVPLFEGEAEALAPDFEVIHQNGGPVAPDPEIRAVVIGPMSGLAPQALEALPSLRLLYVRGAGMKGVDVEALAARGVVLRRGNGTNAAAVAEHAVAMMAALSRRLVEAATRVRAGHWNGFEPMPTLLAGKTLGILGLGDIGTRIAAIAATGYRMRVLYHNRTPRNDALYEYVGDPGTLAEAADYLVCCLPGGAGTRHLLDAALLERLGPKGALVNVGRGSVVNSATLAACLADGRLGAAALDVLEEEPEVPAALRGLPNLVLTPHIAWRAPESETRSRNAMQRALYEIFCDAAG